VYAVIRRVAISRKLSCFLDRKHCGRKLSWPVSRSSSFSYLNELRDTKNKSQSQQFATWKVKHKTFDNEVEMPFAGSLSSSAALSEEKHVSPNIGRVFLLL
jgi:hypothetical protein